MLPEMVPFNPSLAMIMVPLIRFKTRNFSKKSLFFFKDLIREKFLNKFLLNEDFSKTIDEDYKSILQIISQKQFGSVPKYEVNKEVGPPHDRTFHVSVYIDGVKQSSAVGKSKKIAQNNSAKKILKKLKSL